MAQWQRTLDVKDVWNNNDISLIARTAAERLESLPPLVYYPYEEERRLELVDELEELANDPEATTQDFDYVWEEVYDWADTPLDDKWNGKRVCWVKTF